MRVILIGAGVQPIPPTGYGAVERIIADLTSALEEAGNEVEVLNQVRKRRMRDEYPFAWQVPRLLRGRRYDVIHAHTPVVANRLALGGYPYVYTSHSRHWFYRTQWTHRWGYLLERRAVRRAREAIALTPRLAETMATVVRPPLPPITVIPFGVDSSVFRPDWSRRNGARALGVGVVLPFKRWELAARALRGTGVRLRIAGPMPSAEYAAAVRRSGDEVEFLGEISEEELRELYSESDFLIHPSAVEVLSATVLEALAAGLPVIGGSALEGAVDTGVDGWVVPDGELGAFVNGLRERAVLLHTNDAQRRTMGDAARATAQSRYAWPSIAAQHVAVYERARVGAPGGTA